MSKAIVKKPSSHTQRIYDPVNDTYTTDRQSKNEKGQYTHEITSVAPNSFSKTTIIKMQDPERFSKMVQTTYCAYKKAIKNNQLFFIDPNSLPSEIYNELIKQVGLLTLNDDDDTQKYPATIQQATPQQVQQYKRKKAQQAQLKKAQQQAQRKKAQQQAQLKKAKEQAQRKKAQQAQLKKAQQQAQLKKAQQQRKQAQLKQAERKQAQLKKAQEQPTQSGNKE